MPCARDGKGGAVRDGGGFFRAPSETQDLAPLRNNPKNRHGTLAFGEASLNSVAFGSISLRSTRKGALKRNQ